MASLFERIDQEAAELCTSTAFGTRINEIVAHAQEAKTDDERVLWLIDILSYEEDSLVRSWFAQFGVTA